MIEIIKFVLSLVYLSDYKTSNEEFKKITNIAETLTEMYSLFYVEYRYNKTFKIKSNLFVCYNTGNSLIYNDRNALLIHEGKLYIIYHNGDIDLLREKLKEIFSKIKNFILEA